MQVQFLSQKDLLGEEMETHSNIFAWTVPWTEEPGGLQPKGSESQSRLSDYAHLSTSESVPLILLSTFSFLPWICSPPPLWVS